MQSGKQFDILENALELDERLDTTSLVSLA